MEILASVIELGENKVKPEIYRIKCTIFVYNQKRPTDSEIGKALLVEASRIGEGDVSERDHQTHAHGDTKTGKTN
jgi:hypothetical protein